MIDNVTMNIDGHMLIKIVLWLSKLSKHAYSNNHKHKFNTQQLKSIVRTTKSWYVEIMIVLKQLIYLTNCIIYKNYFKIKTWSRNEMLSIIQYYDIANDMLDKQVM